MKRLQNNQKFIVNFTNNIFYIYNSKTNDLIKEINGENAYIYNLSSNILFYANKDALIGIELNNFKRTEIISPIKKISSIFCKDSFLYLGYETGLIHVYTYNSTNYKLINCYVHSGPISLASDGSKIYVTDYRNKVTEFPENKGYDFTEPKLYFKKYIFCSSENNLFARTREAFGFLFSIKEEIEHIEFSEKGGLIFIQTKRGISCYDFMGNERSHFISGDFCIKTENGYCYIVTIKDGKINQQETYLKDIEMDDIAFSKINIVEKAIEGSEYDEKRNALIEDKSTIFVKDGKQKKKQIKVQKKKVSYNNSSENYESSENDEEITLFESKRRSFRKFSESSEKDENITTNISIINEKKQGEIIVDDTRLLHFNNDGYMLSIDLAISCNIIIKYHDNYLEPVEYKDEDKCTTGCFYNDKFVITNGSILNFNGEWKKSLNSKIVGINKKFVFSAGGNLLSIFDYSGNLVKEILIKIFDKSILCFSDEKIAFFSENYVVIFNNDFLSVSYIPISNVNFGCFYENELYVGVGCYLFKLENNLFIKILEFKGIPLIVNEEFLITLSDPIQLLPNINLTYNYAKKEEVKTIDLQLDKGKKFNPYRD